MFQVRVAVVLGALAGALVSGSLASAASAQALVATRAASAEAILGAQPPARVEELMEERIVLLDPGAEKGLVEALVVFAQPPDAVWGLLLQRERQKEYRPELTEIAIIERSDTEVVEEQHLKIAFLSVAYRLRNHIDTPAHALRWDLDPSFESQLQQVAGYWELYPLAGERTLARFGTKVSVNPAVPGFLQNGITRKNVPETLSNTRQWVDSNGRWRP